MSNIEERVKKIVAEQLGVKEDIANDASLTPNCSATIFFTRSSMLLIIIILNL